ncbi:hypothetical protein CVT24_008295 [Panaeolus cyanescens]|uniref:Uncharacterized protein n=1 Tax=Panaeolus cyanescens TaxID=181874 RepID=A0A409W0M9_9AGAR|nr:hypothetical protein CVT24_008295 [Panaeolus cyanescens]
MDSAKKMWEHLVSIHQTKNVGITSYLTFTTIINLRWDGNHDSIQKHIASFSAAKAKLQSLNKPIDDELLAYCLLSSLSNDDQGVWENFQTSVLSNVPAGQVLRYATVVDRLVATALRQGHQGTANQDSAFNANTKNKWCIVHKVDSHNTEDCNAIKNLQLTNANKPKSGKGGGFKKGKRKQEKANRVIESSSDSGDSDEDCAHASIVDTDVFVTKDWHDILRPRRLRLANTGDSSNDSDDESPRNAPLPPQLSPPTPIESVGDRSDAVRGPDAAPSVGADAVRVGDSRANTPPPAPRKRQRIVYKPAPDSIAGRIASRKRGNANPGLSTVPQPKEVQTNDSPSRRSPSSSEKPATPEDMPTSNDNEPEPAESERDDEEKREHETDKDNREYRSYHYRRQSFDSGAERPLLLACVVLWDYLDNVRTDYILAFKTKLGIPTAVYFTTRFVLSLSLLKYIYVTSATKNCHLLGKVLGSLFCVSTGGITLLFFIRLRAVFLGDKRVSWAFAVLWLTVTCAQIMYPVKVHELVGVLNSQGKQICVIVTHEAAPLFSVAPLITLFLYDTLVLLSISWKITTSLSLQEEQSPRKGIRTFVTGQYLPSFSRAILQDNQMYYLCTIPFSIYTIVATLCSDPDGVFTGYTALIPNGAVVNIMAWRVFRNTKLNVGAITNDTSYGWNRTREIRLLAQSQP